MIKEGTKLWQYMSPNQKELARDGNFLIEDSLIHPDQPPTDYSYLVFPFAKLYEGFLKQLFVDLDIITLSDYESDRFRIGKVLSPNLVRRLGRHSAFGELARRYGKGLPGSLWYTWKEARNLVFHYFPHNFRSLSREQAIGLIQLIVQSMEESVALTKVKSPSRVEIAYIGVGAPHVHNRKNILHESIN
jgi:hypothetical protein